MTCEDPLVDGWVGVEVQGGGFTEWTFCCPPSLLSNPMTGQEQLPLAAVVPVLPVTG